MDNKKVIIPEFLTDADVSFPDKTKSQADFCADANCGSLDCFQCIFDMENIDDFAEKNLPEDDR